MFMKKILYVLHSGTTGGTFLTNKDLMDNIKEYYDVFLLTAENDLFKLFIFSNNKLILLNSYSRKDVWSAKKFHDSWISYVYFDVLVKYEIDLIHIRHLINHSFDLPNIANKLNIPVVLSFHDFYFICPFYTLLNENNEFCNGNCGNNKLNCYNPLRSLNDINSKEIISLWRKEVINLFKYVDYFITTADFVKNLFISIYPSIDTDRFKVIEHGRDFLNLGESYNEVPSKEKPIKILFIANHLNIMKGSLFIKKLKELDIDSKFEFHFLGNCHDDLDSIGICHGTFERDLLPQKIKEISPSFVGIFSIWPETFCHTLTESWSCGIPVIGSNIGVIKERILSTGGGWVIDIEDPKKAYDRILEISKDINSYKLIQENIKKINFKSTKDMSNEYLIVYNNLGI